MNAAQLATYSQAKQFFLSTGMQVNLVIQQTINSFCAFFPDYFDDNIKCHIASSMVSGLVTTVASVPVDITKTRLAYTPTQCKHSVL